MTQEKNSPLPVTTLASEPQDRFDGITVFVEVVRSGGFARAAERLNLTRSAVGKSIARLETRLATRLFHRSTRSQSLTDEGQIYYEHCLRALAELQTAQEQIELERHEVAGRLRVTIPVLFGRHYVAPILLALAQQHPKLELQLNFSDQSVDVLAEGFDLAIRMGVLGIESEGLRARKLVEVRKVICASPAYLLAHGSPSNVDELSAHSILLNRRGDRIHTWQVKDEANRLIDVPLRSRLIIDDLEATADAAAAGMGLAWLPEWLVRAHLANGTLVAVLDKNLSATMECHALWPSASHMPIRVRMAVDALVEKLPLGLGVN